MRGFCRIFYIHTLLEYTLQPYSHFSPPTKKALASRAVIRRIKESGVFSKCAKVGHQIRHSRDRVLTQVFTTSVNSILVVDRKNTTDEFF